MHSCEERSANKAVVGEDNIRKLAKEKGFKDEEIDILLNKCPILVGKVIRNYLIEIVKENLKDDSVEYLKMIEKLNTIDVPDHTGCIRIEFKETSDLILVLQIGIVEKETHKFDIAFPSKQALNAIFFRIKKLVDTTGAYYKLLVMKYKDIFELLKIAIPQIDFSELKLNYSTWTMAFHSDSKKRIAPITYYVNKQNQPVEIQIPPVKKLTDKDSS